jgi:hypothetical protein
VTGLAEVAEASQIRSIRSRLPQPPSPRLLRKGPASPPEAGPFVFRNCTCPACAMAAKPARFVTRLLRWTHKQCLHGDGRCHRLFPSVSFKDASCSACALPISFSAFSPSP